MQSGSFYIAEPLINIILIKISVSNSPRPQKGPGRVLFNTFQQDRRKGGRALREFISSHSSLFKIIHFGVTQVFHDRSTYTAILILDKKERECFNFNRMKKLSTEFIAGGMNYVTYTNAVYTGQPWVFVSKESEVIFDKVKKANTIPLKAIAEIPVGLQTSTDKNYIIQPHTETNTTI